MNFTAQVLVRTYQVDIFSTSRNLDTVPTIISELLPSFHDAVPTQDEHALGFTLGKMYLHTMLIKRLNNTLQKNIIDRIKTD